MFFGTIFDFAGVGFTGSVFVAGTFAGNAAAVFDLVGWAAGVVVFAGYEVEDGAGVLTTLFDFVSSFDFGTFAGTVAEADVVVGVVDELFAAGLVAVAVFGSGVFLS